MTAPDDPTARALTLRAHLDGLEDGAIPGPWVNDGSAIWHPLNAVDDDAPSHSLIVQDNYMKPADAALIVALRNDWPAVSALLGALVERVRELGEDRDSHQRVGIKMMRERGELLAALDAEQQRADVAEAELAKVRHSPIKVRPWQ